MLLVAQELYNHDVTVSHMEGVYHVVCHRCPFEGLYRSAKDATGEREAHEHAHDHRVSALEISRPEPSTEV